MVAMIFMCERKVSNLFYYSSVILQWRVLTVIYQSKRAARVYIQRTPTDEASEALEQRVEGEQVSHS